MNRVNLHLACSYYFLCIDFFHVQGIHTVGFKREGYLQLSEQNIGTSIGFTNPGDTLSLSFETGSKNAVIVIAKDASSEVTMNICT